MNHYVPRGRGRRGGLSTRGRFPPNNPIIERNKELRRNMPTSRLQYDESHVNTVRHPRMARQNQEMQGNFHPRPRIPREDRQTFESAPRHPRMPRQNNEQMQDNFQPRPRMPRENRQNFEPSSRFENPNQEVNVQPGRPFRRPYFQQQHENFQRRLAQGDMNHNFEEPFERGDYNRAPGYNHNQDYDQYNDEEYQDGLNHRFSNVRLGPRGRRGDQQFNGRPTRFEGYIQGPNQPNLQRGSGRRGFRQPRSFGDW